MKTMTLTLAGLTALALSTTAFANTEIDTDGDGVMSMEELQAAYPTLSEDLFAAMDANGDGTIDADEFKAAQDAAVLPVTDG
ncbi:MAG: EF-hand domain-containing protein [Pseudomonadota bacterium]